MIDKERAEKLTKIFQHQHQVSMNVVLEKLVDRVIMEHPAATTDVEYRQVTGRYDPADGSYTLKIR